MQTIECRLDSLANHPPLPDYTARLAVISSVLTAVQRSAPCSMFFAAIFFGDIYQLLDQCCLSQRIQIENADIDEAR